MALPVASITTSSVAQQALAEALQRRRVMSTRPARRSRPSSQITTSAKVRWMSMPITRRIPSPLVWIEDGSGGRHDTYGSALSAQPGESQRRPATNASSQLIVRIGLPAPSCSRCLCPGWSHHTPRTTRTTAGHRHRHPHTGYQPAGAPEQRDQAPDRRGGHLPQRGRHHPPDRRRADGTERRVAAAAAFELPAVSLDTVLFREAGGQTAWKVMERR